MPARSHAQQPTLQLQERDIAFLADLNESRIMTVAHAADIHFAGKRAYTHKRLRQLKYANYITERPRHVNEPAIYTITEQTHDLLIAQRHITNETWHRNRNRLNVSKLTLAHELAVMDVKAAFYRQAQTGAFSIRKFITRPEKLQFNAFHPATGRKVLVKPDGFVWFKRIDGNSVSHKRFYVEVDRSTESLMVLFDRLVLYRKRRLTSPTGEHERSTAVHGRRNTQVLVVCQNEKRLTAIAEELKATSVTIARSLKAISMARLAEELTR